QYESLEWLRERGFRVNPDIAVHSGTEDVIAACRAWEERREQLDYDIDGVVVKVNDLALQRSLGVVGREPRGAVAWKFPPTTATTRLNKIAWNVGRTGHMVPFAMLEPVQVSGVTVKLFVGAMDIDGLGEQNVIRFLGEGLIEDVADLYDLSVERLTELDRFGETSASNLVRNIAASKEQPFFRVLYGLGIAGIGWV